MGQSELKLQRYEEVSPLYELGDSPAFFTFMVGNFVLLLAGFVLFSFLSLVISTFIFCVVLLCVGGAIFKASKSDRVLFPRLLADDQALYFLASHDGKVFLRTPKKHICSFVIGNVGLNNRGINFNVKKGGLSEGDKTLLFKEMAYIRDMDDTLEIGVVTGVNRRDQVAEKLKSMGIYDG